MNTKQVRTNILAQTAIEALKNAYENCTEQEARKSIIAAFKAVIQLNLDLEIRNINDTSTELDLEYDHSEFCAAV